MKIAIAATAPRTDAPVDDRFGRCPYFVIIDDQEISSVSNPGLRAAGGAGVATAQYLAVQKVDAVCAGNVGPNALAVLAAAKIRVYQTIAGTVRDNLDALRDGRLTAVNSATVPSHTGSR
ncbi:MAG: NifB/NifX family molybdenum-iron cluster-binding protein [Bacillota bacterium]